MDFLDPKATRRHRTRLVIGYILMATLILGTSAVLVFSAYGFDVDRKTGEVIQNGLVFIDSAPDEATVVLNDQIQKDKTNNRFSLPAGQYSMKLQKEGYRNWQRDFTISGGEVERFTYPLLLPNELAQREVQAFDAVPTFTSNSPDRRWIIVNKGGSLSDYIEYDLNSVSNVTDLPTGREFLVPPTLFTATGANHTLQLVEWSNDNKHFLAKHTFDGGSEFIVVSRDQPETSININRTLGLNPTSVTLRDKKFDQWYLFTEAGGVLQAADVKKAVTTVAQEVVAYKSHDDSTVLYSTLKPGAAKQQVMLKQGNDTVTIKEIANGPTMLDIARYDGKWHAVIGSSAEQKTYVYIDPLQTLQKADPRKPLVPAAILKATGAMTWVGFSQNTRFIVTQSGQHFEVFDAEYDQNYKFDITEPFDASTPVTWMDGHRMTGRFGGKAVIFDFDGSNRQELVGVLPTAPLLFNRDFTTLYSVAGKEAAAALYDTQLRLDGDR